jgi:hypothetical protein
MHEPSNDAAYDGVPGDYGRINRKNLCVSNGVSNTEFVPLTILTALVTRNQFVVVRSVFAWRTNPGDSGHDTTAVFALLRTILNCGDAGTNEVVVYVKSGPKKKVFVP